MNHRGRNRRGFEEQAGSRARELRPRQVHVRKVIRKVVRNAGRGDRGDRGAGSTGAPPWASGAGTGGPIGSLLGCRGVEALAGPALPASRASTGFPEVLDLLSCQPGAGTGCVWQHAAGIRGDFEIFKQVRGCRIGLDRRVEGQRQRPVDQGPPGHVVPVDEGHGHAAAAGPAGAADAVKVDVLVLGALIVDHVGHPADVDAAGRHIGGNQNIDLAGSERP